MSIFFPSTKYSSSSSPLTKDLTRDHLADTARRNENWSELLRLFREGPIFDLTRNNSLVDVVVRTQKLSEAEVLKLVEAICNNDPSRPLSPPSIDQVLLEAAKRGFSTVVHFLCPASTNEGQEKTALETLDPNVVLEILSFQLHQSLKTPSLDIVSKALILNAECGFDENVKMLLGCGLAKHEWSIDSASQAAAKANCLNTLQLMLPYSTEAGRGLAAIEAVRQGRFDILAEIHKNGPISGTHRTLYSFDPTQPIQVQESWLSTVVREGNRYGHLDLMRTALQIPDQELHAVLHPAPILDLDWITEKNAHLLSPENMEVSMQLAVYKNCLDKLQILLSYSTEEGRGLAAEAAARTGNFEALLQILQKGPLSSCSAYTNYYHPRLKRIYYLKELWMDRIVESAITGGHLDLALKVLQFDSSENLDSKTLLATAAEKAGRRDILRELFRK